MFLGSIFHATPLLTIMIDNDPGLPLLFDVNFGGDRHYNSLALHKQDDYNNRILTSVTSSRGPRYDIVSTHLLFSMIKSMISIALGYLLATRSHMHMSDVTNLLLIFF